VFDGVYYISSPEQDKRRRVINENIKGLENITV
jgi:hypothetical protein